MISISDSVCIICQAEKSSWLNSKNWIIKEEYNCYFNNCQCNISIHHSCFTNWFYHEINREYNERQINQLLPTQIINPIRCMMCRNTIVPAQKERFLSLFGGTKVDKLICWSFATIILFSLLAILGLLTQVYHTRDWTDGDWGYLIVNCLYTVFYFSLLIHFILKQFHLINYQTVIKVTIFITFVDIIWMFLPHVSVWIKIMAVMIPNIRNLIFSIVLRFC